MKRFLTAFALMAGFLSALASNPWYGINYDKKTVAAMVAAYGIEAAAETQYGDQAKKILKHYSVAEVASAGIFMSKYLDRKGLTDLGIWMSEDENYYYKRIYSLVSSKIMPKIWTVAKLMLKSPDNALYWGSYLYKVCAEVEALCMQFESVVTNSTLSFKDIVFLRIADEFLPLFKLTETGGMDWKRFFDEMSSIPNNLSKETLQGDLDRLYQMGVDIATAGMENMTQALLGGSSFHAIANGSVPAIVNAVNSSYAFFKALDANMKQTLLSLVGGPDAVARLFDVRSYDILSWTDDYARESMGQFYTQRWYIFRKDAGSQVLCDYAPPKDEDSVVYGSHWTRFSTTDSNFSPTTAQNEQILANSESHAGWSRAMVERLNASGDGCDYRMSSSRSAFSLNKGGKLYARAYAFSIKVEKSWDLTEEVYEEVFDSYSMDMATFQAMMQAMLSELNDNEEGYVYTIGCDEKRYYYATDEAKLKGTESVIISVACSDGMTLAKGSTQYKCGTCGGSLSEHTKECSMMTSCPDEGFDTSELDALERECDAEIDALRSQIAALEEENQQIVKQLVHASAEEGYILRQKYFANKDKIAALNVELKAAEEKKAELQNAREEASASEDVQTDDHYRIPAIMQECRDAFDLDWKDAGRWEGYTFVRTATSGRMHGEITFKATISIAMKPKYLLGIKIHRAIVQIEWELTSETSSTQVVEVLELDPSKPDKENVQMVNEKISEIAQAYPNCAIITEYIKNEGIESDDTEDIYHLLWSSDRLEIARQVEARLTHIYADLVSLEKMMHYKLSIVDRLRRYAPYVNDLEGKKMTILEEAHRRWLQNARLRK